MLMDLIKQKELGRFIPDSFYMMELNKDQFETDVQQTSSALPEGMPVDQQRCLC